MLKQVQHDDTFWISPFPLFNLLTGARMTQNYVILGDTTCNLSAEIRNKYDIEYIHSHIIYPDGKDRIATLKWSDYTYFGDNCTSQIFYNELKKNPDSKINCVDSLRFGSGIGLMLVHAAILRNQGKSFEEVSNYLENSKCKFHQMGWLDDLSFVAKKGRNE